MVLKIGFQLSNICLNVLYSIDFWMKYDTDFSTARRKKKKKLAKFAGLEKTSWTSNLQKLIFV